MVCNYIRMSGTYEHVLLLISTSDAPPMEMRLWGKVNITLAAESDTSIKEMRPSLMLKNMPNALKINGKLDISNFTILASS